MTPDEIDAIENRLYAFNREAVGRDDAQSLGFVIRDEAGAVIAAAAGFSWAGSSELKQLWVDRAHRGHGHGRTLLDAFVAEAARRGVKRIWVQSHGFQAPDFYERAGFVRMAEFADWPEGHTNVILCRSIAR